MNNPNTYNVQPTTYNLIVGMEVHAELKTDSKMFCGCKNDPFHAPKPNIYTCPVCLGMPGGLPVANKVAIEWTIKLGLALNCKINLFSKFDRKNYFYPDLPKGYQISQYDIPFCVDGVLETDEGPVRIRRIHLEEDTGKLQHTTISVNSENRHPEKSSLTSNKNTISVRPEYSGTTKGIVNRKVSLLDFNRGGVPLVEIVTEPDIHSASHAKAYGKKLRQILRYLDISDCNMEEGSLRLEANISLSESTTHTPDSTFHLPNYKVEVKNINSFTYLEKAIQYEAVRQQELLEKGETPAQETRGWNEKENKTFSQRTKEDAGDYRYFPDPDLPPITFTEKQISSLRSQLPELPDQKIIRWEKEYAIEPRFGAQLSTSLEKANKAEAVFQLAQAKKSDPNKIASAVINKKISADTFEDAERTISAYLEMTKVDTIDESELQTIINSVLIEQPHAVENYKSGKEQIIGFLIGQTMRKLGKKIDPKIVSEAIKKMLSS